MVAAEEACAELDLYSFPDYADDYTQGVLKIIYRRTFGLPELPYVPPSRLAACVRDYGASPLGKYGFEDILARRVDTPLAGILRRILNSPPSADVPGAGILARFLALAVARGPYWFRCNREGLRRRTTEFQSQYKVRSLMRHPEVRRLIDAQDLVMAETSYLLALAGTLDEDLVPTFCEEPYRLVCLDASRSGTKFVLCDNPARQFRVDSIGVLGKLDQPGLVDPRTLLVFPLSPRYAVAVSTRQDLRPREIVYLTNGEVRTINTAMLTLAVNDVIYPSPGLDYFLPGVRPLDVAPWEEPGPPVFGIPTAAR